MRPGDTTRRLIKVISAATGVGVTGLVIGDLAITSGAWYTDEAAPATWTPGATLTEVGAGLYWLLFAMPAARGEWSLFVQPNNAAYFCFGQSGWSGETESFDLDAMAAAVALPSAVVGQTSRLQLGTQIQLELIKDRYRLVQLELTDADGNPIDGTLYSTLKVSFRSADQTTNKYDITSGITFDSDGILTFAVPEDATALFAALATGQASTSMFWEAVGDLDSNTAHTVAIVRSSPCLITRCEVGT